MKEGKKKIIKAEQKWKKASKQTKLLKESKKKNQTQTHRQTDFGCGIAAYVMEIQSQIRLRELKPHNSSRSLTHRA
jgi:predicted nucleotide-binding protein (sugar kinase/HSP70/actin superfamily)